MTDGHNQPDAESPANIPSMGLSGTVLLFGGAAVLLLGATRLIPGATALTGLEPVLLWFVAGGLGVFAPLLLAAAVLLHQEGVLGTPGGLRGRLRFHPMTIGDWLWSFGGLAAIGLLSAGSLIAMQLWWGEVRLHPSFMSMEPLTPDRYWILAAWLPFWVLNIMAEEVFWRGVVLPRQEMAFGRWACLVNGVGWLMFHLPFGPAILLTVAPTTLILPYVAQRRRNSWTGVVIHAGLNGPGFLAVAFGVV